MKYPKIYRKRCIQCNEFFCAKHKKEYECFSCKYIKINPIIEPWVPGMKLDTMEILKYFGCIKKD